MGGKGRRRREKNYRVAHGGQSGLPPPPDRSALDAVPSKLRKIMSFAGTGTGTGTGGKASSDGADKIRTDRGRAAREMRRHLEEDKVGSKITGIGNDGEDGNLTTKYPDHDEDVESSMQEKKKKKRKRKQVSDLRFELSDELGGVGSKRKERKKQRLEERKKKRKKIREGGDLGFQAHDEVKFGDVVEAPPKLVTVPKAFKTNQDASQERLRIQAVEAYRKRKGWTSRLGVQLPLTATGSQDLSLS